MDTFARLAREERSELFRLTADQMGIHPVNVEKDFWVCWLLKHLFTIPAFAGWLVFKGGTSLSKCFNLIQRFSEDIDLAVNFERLGFIGARDPRRADLSRNQRQVLLDEMMEQCRAYVAGAFLESLRERVRSILGDGGWSLAVADADPNTVEFAYPPAIELRLAYIQPHVSLELGTHAEPIPHGSFSIKPFVAERYLARFAEPSLSVEAVVARRTFWEKATILHAEYHRPLDRRMPARYSRHYVDVFMMARSAIRAEAIGDMGLLANVVTHKDRFYPAAWARYQEARPGSFHLMPRDERLADLRADYQSMRTMFIGEAPDFEEVLGELERLEKEINGAPQ